YGADRVGSWGLVLGLQGGLEIGHVAVPVGFEAVQVVAEGGPEGGKGPVGPGAVAVVGSSEQVEEGHEALGVLFPEIKHEGPGRGVVVLAVAVAESDVSHQGGEPGGGVDLAPVRETEVVGPADAGPSAAPDDLELGGEPFVKPDREVVVPGRQAAVGDELVDHLMRGRAEVDRPAIE